MPGTMSKANVIEPPKSDKKLPLAMFLSLDTRALGLKIAAATDADAQKISWSEAKKVAKQVKDKSAEYENAYWKVGLIGKDLVFRVKADNINGNFIQKLFKSKEYFDVTLLSGVAMKAAEKSGGSDTIGGGSYFVLTASECPKIFNDYIDVGKGYALNPSITIEGAGKNPALRAEIEKERKALLTSYQAKCKQIAKEVGDKLAKLTIASGKSLEDICKEADGEFRKLLDQGKIAKEFEDNVKAMVAKNSNFKQHHTEWKIKGICTAVIATLKLATNALKLVASHGADVTSYISIVSNCKAIYGVVSDFRKAEEAVIKELEKAITLYQNQTDSLLKDVKAIYDEYKLDKATAWEKLKAGPSIAADAVQQVKNKITKVLKGSKVAAAAGDPPPETARKRYVVEVGKSIKALEDKYKELEKSITAFKNSDITKAVQLWAPLQTMKKAAADALTAMQDRKTYAESAKSRIEALGISTSDVTTLDKLQTFAKGVQQFDKDQVVSGAGGVATVAGTVKSAYDALDGLVSAVKAVV